MLTLTRVGGSSGEVSVRVTTSSTPMPYAMSSARGSNTGGNIERVLPGVVSVNENTNAAQFTAFPDLNNLSKPVRTFML